MQPAWGVSAHACVLYAAAAYINESELTSIVGARSQSRTRNFHF